MVFGRLIGNRRTLFGNVFRVNDEMYGIINYFRRMNRQVTRSTFIKDNNPGHFQSLLGDLLFYDRRTRFILSSVHATFVGKTKINKMFCRHTSSHFKRVRTKAIFYFRRSPRHLYVTLGVFRVDSRLLKWPTTGKLSFMFCVIGILFRPIASRNLTRVPRKQVTRIIRGTNTRRSQYSNFNVLQRDGVD